MLTEINLAYSLEGLMLKLKLQYFGYLMGKVDSLEKTLMLGKTECRRKRGWQRTRCFDDITDSMDMSLSKLQEMVKDKEIWHAAVHGVTKHWMRLSNLHFLFFWFKMNIYLFKTNEIQKCVCQRKYFYIFLIFFITRSIFLII